MADMLAEDTDSIVRRNLLTQEGYTPYCGADTCALRWPRTRYDGEQFVCRCGFRSEFPGDFLARYRAAWPRQNAKG